MYFKTERRGLIISEKSVAEGTGTWSKALWCAPHSNWQVYKIDGKEVVLMGGNYVVKAGFSHHPLGAESG